MLAMSEPEERRLFRLGWSDYRRAHQAVAARCKKASRAAKRALHRQGSSEDHSGPEPAIALPEGAPLTDAEWRALEPILPPQRLLVDARTMITGRFLEASCGLRVQAHRGGRCPGSSVNGRRLTVGTSCG